MVDPDRDTPGINVEAAFSQWKLDGNFGQGLIKKAVAIASLPVALFWTLIWGVGTAIMGIVAWIFKFLGKIFTRSK